MSFFGNALAVLGLLCVAVQAAELQNSSWEPNSMFVSMFFTNSQNIDQSLVLSTCNMIDVRHKANCYLEVKMADGTENHCNVRLSVPETDAIDLGMSNPMKLARKLSGRKTQLEWYSWPKNKRCDDSKWVSFVDMADCSAVHILDSEVYKMEKFNENYTESFIPRIYEISQTIENSLFYVTCDVNKYQTTASCTFKQKYLSDTVLKCSATLEAPDYNRIEFQPGAGSLNVMHGGKTAVLKWSSWKGSFDDMKKVWMLTLINMDQCNSTVLEFPLDNHRASNLYTLFYDNAFDVYVNSWESCDDRYIKCILRYNHKGEKIRDPVPFHLNSYTMSSAMVVERDNSSSGGFFMEVNNNYGYDLNSVTVRHVNHDGLETMVFENHRVQCCYEDGYWKQSSEYGYFSLCHPDDRVDRVRSNDVRCVQYDLTGQQVLNNTVTLPEWPRMLKIFNQPFGGIFILYFDLDDSLSMPGPRSRLENTIMHVKVQVLATDGRITMKANLTDIDLRYSNLKLDQIRINYEETNTESCFYFGYAQYHQNYTTFHHRNKCLDL